MRRLLVLVAIAAMVVVIILAIWRPDGPSREEIVAAAGKYDVRILRDTWGVPHIFGRTDADAAFGLAYAQAEDDMPTVIESVMQSRGTLASVQGKDAAPGDYMVHLLRVWPTVEEKYESDLSPEIRGICEAYADGLNLYAALHPDEINHNLLPFTGKDVVAGFVFKGPFFFGLDNTIMDLFENERKHPVSEKNVAKRPMTSLTEGLPVGSNAFAVSPKRSADGSTFLNINSHQPWEGPVAWYEAHMHSEEGMDIVGGVFPGVPIILHGHNRNLGWAHTVNKPDLVDVYVLEMNRDNPNQYRFDGEWRDLEVGEAPVKVKLWGPFSWTFKREILWSVHGPVVRQDHGVYAIRYAGMGDIRTVEQWYRMGKAQTEAEWMEAMKMQAIPSFNCIYADRTGNIGYVYNAKFPKRVEGYDWKQYLPGNTSETLWTDYQPFNATPIAFNPDSGFLLNCNSSPAQCTSTSDDPYPRQEAFAPDLDIETHMTNRALRAMELLSADESITEEEFYAYKYDMAYSRESEIAKGWRKVLDADAPNDPIIREALDVWRTWDLHTNPENTAAAVCVLTIGPGSDNDPRVTNLDETFALLKRNAEALKATHGRIDVPWGDVNRVHRGDVNRGVGGGPDILHAVYGFRVRNGQLEGLDDNGEIYGRAGDCLVLLATWDEEGKVHSRSIHQYGSATSRPDSPHYADQVPLFVRRDTKPVWMDEADIRANLEREYRPGTE